jgi:nucleotide-binding universal stress UspA family protein
MTIVVATDGSDHARKAVELASDIAEKYDAKLVLLNVLIRGRKLQENMRSMLAAAVQSPSANRSWIVGKKLPRKKE